MTIQPLNDRVLVKVQEFKSEAEESSLIIRPDVAQAAPQTGVVVAVGQGRIHDNGHVTPLKVKAGDKVIFGLYTGADVTLLDGHKIMREDEICGILTD